MRCQSCNRALDDFESTRKHAVTGEYIDLCNKCFPEVKYCIPVIERHDLSLQESIVENDNEEYEFDEELS